MPVALLRLDDVGLVALVVAGDAAGVDQELGVGDDVGPVVGGVVGGDDDAVVLGELGGGELDGAHLQVVVAHLGGGGDVGVVVVDGGAQVLELLDDLEGRAFADVVDVGLVRE